MPAVAVLIASTFLTGAAGAQKRMSATDAQTGEPTTGYIKANASGCKVWVPLQMHAPDYVPRYTGECKDGIAQGKGSLQWLYAYAEMRVKTTWQGNFQDGVYVGDKPMANRIEPQPQSNDFWVHMGAIGGGDVVVIAKANDEGRMDLCHPDLIALSLNAKVKPTDDVAVKQAMTDAAARLGAECSAFKYSSTQIDVFTVPFRKDAEGKRPERIASTNISWSNRTLMGYENRASSAVRNDQMKAARESRAADAKKRFDDFTRRNGITAWVTAEQLDKNPFKYEGKTVGVIVQLDRMVTPNVAVVEGGLSDDGGSVQVHGITPDFPEKKSVLLAAKVGRREALADGTTTFLSFTGVTRVSAETCEKSECYDWLEWARGDDRIHWGDAYSPLK